MLVQFERIISRVHAYTYRMVDWGRQRPVLRSGGDEAGTEPKEHGAALTPFACPGESVVTLSAAPRLYEDEHLISVNKLVAAPTQVNRTGSIAPASVGQLYDVHRLDTPVSGVVLYARTRTVATRLSAMFRRGEIRKTYWAAVESPPEPYAGELEHYLVHRHKENRSVWYGRPMPGGKRCVCRYTTIGESDRYWFVELHPESGRTHQLRVQLSAIGCPVKGDRKYGARRGNRDRMIHLHARELSFRHPILEHPISIVAAPPADPVWDTLTEQLDRAV